MKNWSEILDEKMPLLGHRNWIVVTDMAYPLQSNKGITTLFADQDYITVLNRVKQTIDKQPHVFAHIYRDDELQKIDETLVNGIDVLKCKMDKACASPNTVFMPHEEIIRKLDEVSKLFEVVIIKTKLTVPYTSTFFELDCGYWDAERQAELNKRLK